MILAKRLLVGPFGRIMEGQVVPASVGQALLSQWLTQGVVERVSPTPQTPSPPPPPEAPPESPPVDPDDPSEIRPRTRKRP